jgi:hypothetical protein
VEIVARRSDVRNNHHGIPKKWTVTKVDEGRMKKIVVIGLSGDTIVNDDVRVDWVPWNKLRRIANLSDCDGVFLVLSTIDHADQKNAPDWAYLNEMLTPKTLRHILDDDGHVIVLGDPRFSIKKTYPNGIEVESPFLDWTGVKFVWDDRPGTSIRFPNERQHYPLSYASVVSELRSWNYSLQDANPDSYLPKQMFGDLLGGDSRVEAFPFAYVENRYGKPLAFELVYQFKRSRREGTYPQIFDTVMQFDTLVFIPDTSLDPTEAIARLLDSLYDVQLVTQEPEWVRTLVAPGQDAHDQEVARLHAELERLRSELRDAETQRAEVRKPLKLLYAKQLELEPLVHDAFAQLGATVHSPLESGKADFWLTVELDGSELAFVGEIKSIDRKTFKENGLQQLASWQARGIAERGTRAKQVFVGNYDVLTDPDQRENPFHANFQRTASLQEVCVITSQQLYDALVLLADNTLDREKFWKGIDATNGLFDLAAVVQRE